MAGDVDVRQELLGTDSGAPREHQQVRAKKANIVVIWWLISVLSAVLLRQLWRLAPSWVVHHS